MPGTAGPVSRRREPHFAFGANWRSFVNKGFDEKRVAAAVNSLRTLLKVSDLRGMSFLDIGCGSGLFSLAAYLLGAEKVVGFDDDADSVQASLDIRDRAKIPPSRWHVLQGSVLDEVFLERVEPADVVYAWGVLHHTGSMWKAIASAGTKVKPGGLFAISVYNDVERLVGGSRLWWHIKRTYNLAPDTFKRLMDFGYVASFVVRQLLTGRNPVTAMNEYGSGRGRGMDFWHDVRDWLGGFPYEYATAGTVFDYVHGSLGFDLEHLNTHDGHGCNEFTFRRVVAGVMAPIGGASGH